jgi:hypothetical protein
VEIEVGKDAKKQTFHIHKKLLTGKSPVFDKMFNGGFKESSTQFATLPKDDPVVFDIFVQWLYSSTIHALKLASAYDDVLYNLLFDVHYFALKYVVIELADRAVTSILEVMNGFNILPTPTQWAAVYRKTARGSKLRLLMTRSAVFVLLCLPENVKEFTKTAISDVFEADKDFLLDVLTAIRPEKSYATTKELDPRKAPCCDYHEHPKTNVCPYPN